MSQSTPVTEIVKCPLKPGTDLGDSNSVTGKIFQDIVNTILGQPGAEGAFWAVEDDDPSTMHLFINWKSLDAHRQFMASREYGPFLKTFNSMLSGPATGPYHFEPTPYPPIVLSRTVAPVVEHLTAHFGTASLPDSTRTSFAKKMNEFSQAFASHAPGFKGASGGYTTETDILNTSKNTRGQAWVFLIGWESVEAHMKYRETDSFKEEIKLLRGEEVKGMEVSHILPQDAAMGVGGTGSTPGDAQEEVLNPQGNKGAAPEARSDGTTTKKHHGWGT